MTAKPSREEHPATENHRESIGAASGESRQQILSIQRFESGPLVSWPTLASKTFLLSPGWLVIEDITYLPTETSAASCNLLPVAAYYQVRSISTLRSEPPTYPTQ